MIKKRYQITYSLLDNIEVGNQTFYVKEEAQTALKNLGYKDKRSVIFLLDLLTLQVENWKLTESVSEQSVALDSRDVYA